MIENLLKYQEKDAELRKIETELSGSEERKKAIVAKKYLDGVEENVAKLDARAATLYEEYNIALGDQAKLKEQEAEFVKAVESAADETETAYLIKKIDELAGKIKNLLSRAEKLSEEMTAVMKEYVKIKNETKAAQAQYAENGKKYNDLKASV